MGLTCVTCGDAGYTNAFVHCVACLNFVVHRYCLDVIPKTYDEYVHWLCEDCALKALHKRYKINFKALENGEGQLLFKLSSEENEKEKNKAKHTSVSHEKHAEEKKRLENGEGEFSYKLSSEENGKEKPKDNQAKHTSVSHEKNVKEKKRSLVEPAMEDGLNSKKLRKECTRDTTRLSKSGNGSVLPKKKGEKKSDENILSEQPCEAKNVMTGSGNNIKDSVLPKEKEDDEKSLFEQPYETDVKTGRNQNHFLNMKDDGVTASSGFDNHGSQKSSEARDQIQFAKDSSITPPYLDPEAPNEPKIRPVWRGCFEILGPNQRRLEEFVAHMAHKACDKAIEVASQFPPVLQLEIVPKRDVWPKSFVKLVPSVNNIALYFFPSKTSMYEYDQLVQKMVDDDVAMRAHVQNAELLLFPSTELPIRDWRLQEKYYIWGVFKGKPAT